jgi:hypothetical protein
MFVSLKIFPPKVGELPTATFTVDHIIEGHWSAPLDDLWHEPKCVAVMSTIVPVSVLYAPSALRQLTKEETELLNARIRDQEAINGPAHEITVIGGVVTKIEKATGKIISTYPTRDND